MPRNTYSSAHILTSLEALSQSPHLLHLLATATTQPKRNHFVSQLIHTLPNTFEAHSDDSDPTQLFQLITSWYGRHKNLSKQLKPLQLALMARQEQMKTNRKDKRVFIERIGLDWGAKEREDFFKGVKVIYLNRLESPSPPKYTWMIETDSINNRWADHIQNGKLPDKRHKRLPIHRVQSSDIILDIEANQNAIIYDSTTKKLVMVVFRGFVNHPTLLNSIEEVVKKNCEIRKSARLEDPGKLVQVGYSAGARSKPSINWVKNVLSKHTSSDLIDTLDQQTAHIYSLFWMLIQKKLPIEVSEDLITWLAKTKIPRMNKATLLQFQEPEGEIELNVGGQLFNFESEFAPPSGAMAVNYSRFVHHESQLHKFAISWTISRTLEDNQGGHFYNCSYGIRVKGGNDTVVAWDPFDWHGTSLQDYSPTTQTISDYNQLGLAIVTPNRLVALWDKLVGERENSEAFKELYDNAEESDM